MHENMHQEYNASAEIPSPVVQTFMHAEAAFWEIVGLSDEPDQSAYPPPIEEKQAAAIGRDNFTAYRQLLDSVASFANDPVSQLHVSIDPELPQLTTEVHDLAERIGDHLELPLDANDQTAPRTTLHTRLQDVARAKSLLINEQTLAADLQFLEDSYAYRIVNVMATEIAERHNIRLRTAKWLVRNEVKLPDLTLRAMGHAFKEIVDIPTPRNKLQLCKSAAAFMLSRLSLGAIPPLMQTAQRSGSVNALGGRSGIESSSELLDGVGGHWLESEVIGPKKLTLNELFIQALLYGDLGELKGVHSAADIERTIRDGKIGMAEIMRKVVGEATPAVSIMAASTAALGYIHPALAGIEAAALPGLYYLSAAISRRHSLFLQRCIRLEAATTRAIHNLAEGQEELRAGAGDNPNVVKAALNKMNESDQKRHEVKGKQHLADRFTYLPSIVATAGIAATAHELSPYATFFGFYAGLTATSGLRSIIEASREMPENVEKWAALQSFFRALNSEDVPGGTVDEHRVPASDLDTFTIALDNMYAAYGDKTVIRGLDADFEQGVHLLMGPSGEGKSSLLRAIAGTIPSQGVVIGGMATTKIRKFGADGLRRRIGFSSQRPVFFSDATIGANLLPWATPDEMKAKHQEVVEYARRLRLDPSLTNLHAEMPRAFSGGERQRLGVLRALLADPDILLLDEPTAGLDDRSKIGFTRALEYFHYRQRGLRSEIDQSKKRRATVIITSHDHRLMQLLGKGIYAWQISNNKGRTSLQPYVESRQGINEGRQRVIY